MTAGSEIVFVTGLSDSLVRSQWLQRAEVVHRELRLQIVGEYSDFMLTVFANGGEMVLVAEGDNVVGLAVFRCLITTFSESELYVEDLVVLSTRRSQGIGKVLLTWLRSEAVRRGMKALTLNSGTQRKRAHRFYFMQGMSIEAFHFSEKL